MAEASIKQEPAAHPREESTRWAHESRSPQAIDGLGDEVVRTKGGYAAKVVRVDVTPGSKPSLFPLSSIGEARGSVAAVLCKTDDHLARFALSMRPGVTISALRTSPKHSCEADAVIEAASWLGLIPDHIRCVLAIKVPYYLIQPDELAPLREQAISLSSLVLYDGTRLHLEDAIDTSPIASILHDPQSFQRHDVREAHDMARLGQTKGDSAVSAHALARAGFELPELACAIIGRAYLSHAKRDLILLASKAFGTCDCSKEGIAEISEAARKKAYGRDILPEDIVSACAEELGVPDHLGKDPAERLCSAAFAREHFTEDMLPPGALGELRRVERCVRDLTITLEVWDRFLGKAVRGTDLVVDFWEGQAALWEIGRERGLDLYIHSVLDGLMCAQDVVGIPIYEDGTFDDTVRRQRASARPLRHTRGDLAAARSLTAAPKGAQAPADVIGVIANA